MKQQQNLGFCAATESKIMLMLSSVPVQNQWFPCCFVAVGYSDHIESTVVHTEQLKQGLHIRAGPAGPHFWASAHRSSKSITLLIKKHHEIDAFGAPTRIPQFDPAGSHVQGFA